MFSATAPWATIVGVAADVKARGLQAEVPPMMYFPYAQSGVSAYYQPQAMTLVMRTTGAADAPLVRAVRGIIRDLGTRVAVSQVATMNDVVGQSIASRRFTTGLVAAFAALALVLAAIGIYGVIAYGVTQQRYEIGVRVALGATPSSVIALVLRDASRTVVAGLAIGIAGALLVNQLLRSLLVRTSTTDVPTMALVALAIVGVAAVACLAPARRATLVSPTEALRVG
jgi:putative ABC transport system permease protein